MTTRHALLHVRTIQALLDLSNPNKSVCLPLVKGKAAGKMELIYQLYPPRGVHRNSIPATYTFGLDDWVTEEIDLMVSIVDTGDDGDGMIFGFISHDCWCSFRDRAGIDTVDSQQHYVVVKYNPVVREGFIYLYKEAYAVIEKVNKSRLDNLHELKREEAARKATGAVLTEVKARAEEKKGAVRVLVADDSATWRETLHDALSRRGYAVDVVEDGNQLMLKLEYACLVGPPYEFVITDNDMPLLTGLQVLRRIRTSGERFKFLPVVVLSGNDQTEKAVTEAGGLYLPKGCQMDEIDKIIKNVVRKG